MQPGHGETIKEPQGEPGETGRLLRWATCCLPLFGDQIGESQKKNNTRLVLDVGTPSLLFTFMVRAHSLSLIYESTIILIAVF